MCGRVRDQSRYFHSKGFSQNQQFRVRDTSELRLYFREGRPAQLQPKNRATGRKKLLRQSPLISQFSDLRADDVAHPFLSCGHALKMELESNEDGALSCSKLGATFWTSLSESFNAGQYKYSRSTYSHTRCHKIGANYEKLFTNYDKHI